MMIKLFIAFLSTAYLCTVSLNTAAADKMGQTKGEYNAAKDRADCDYDASYSRCKTFSGNDRDVCIEKAKAAYSKAEAEAETNFEGTAGAKSEAREEIIAANYTVSMEICDWLSSDAKDLCVAEAKANNAEEEAALEADYPVAKNVTAHCLALFGNRVFKRQQ